jgi:23S rRNA pseudouridine1911/1915/1917 synthase
MLTDNAPYVIEETPDFAVVFKPPRMHSAPLAKKEGGTLLDWFTAREQVLSPQSSANLMHRLDFDTHGLVLFAKNAESFEFFKELQDSGGFVKEYSAVCAVVPNAVASNESSIPGFPPPPVLTAHVPSPENPLVIESFFRPFGPGRKLVRPVIEEGKKSRETAKDNGGFYRTEITGINKNIFTVRIKRGFRHQIRCHLCWIGRPILNDPLYPHPLESGALPMSLRACSLFFTDPSTGKQREYKIDKF